MRRIAWIACLIALAVTARTAWADEPRAELRLGDRDSPHVGVPFHLDLVIEGFDEAPQPEPPKLEIANAQVTFVAAQPNVSRGIRIINGRRSDFASVTWVMRWRVEPRKEGRIRIPALTISQGSRRVSTTPAEAPVDTLPLTDAMKLSLALPERPIFVGETVPVTLTWLFRGQPQADPTWAIPLLTMDAFTASGPPADNPRNLLTIPAGAKELQLPYAVDQITQAGTRYNRLTTTFFLAPKQAGKLEVPASSVIAALPVGRPDFFGSAPSRLFRAADVPHTLEVKPLPETDKPNNFAGAVGEQFAIGVQTSRSVVKLGEPVELTIRIKSNQRLDTLALGRIDGEGGLPKDKFAVPSEPATGELSDDGKTKTFKVTAQVTGPATEVPAIAFAYFDPTRSTYQTVRSEPIALSVAGGSVVSASDVVAASPKPGPRAGAGAQASALEADSSLVDAELALSSAGQENDRPIDGAVLWVLVGLLYAIPLLVLAARSWQLRTQGQREEAAEVRTARRRVEDLLDRSASLPAREVAGPLAAALRELARLLGCADDMGLLARIETESFSQGAANVPLSADLRSDAAGLLRRWTTEARRSRSTRTPGTAAVAIVGLGLGLGLGASDALAAPIAAPARIAHDASALGEGRTAYQEAMQLTGNATARKAAFARAKAAFGEAVRVMPDRPELLTDWGNAALGAGDVATATLAFRRALAIDGGNLRARHNLAWLRSRQPDLFRPLAGGATDTLLFFQAWPRARKLLVGSAAFAIAILLLVPWSGRRRRGLAGGSLLPLAVWVAMLASVVFEDRHPDDAVVMDDVVLRAADSAGAPAALSQPLPRGVEVTVIEHREAWTKVRLAGGPAGWIPAGAVEHIAR
jgi:hypothetical protein